MPTKTIESQLESLINESRAAIDVAMESGMSFERNAVVDYLHRMRRPELADAIEHGLHWGSSDPLAEEAP